MDVGSALVGALLTAPLSGVVGTWVGGRMSNSEQAARVRREDEQAAGDALRRLRAAYRRVSDDTDDAPEPTVVADLEDDLHMAVLRLPTATRALAARYVSAGQARAARLPGSAQAEESAYYAVADAVISAG